MKRKKNKTNECSFLPWSRFPVHYKTKQDCEGSGSTGMLLKVNPSFIRASCSVIMLSAFLSVTSLQSVEVCARACVRTCVRACFSLHSNTVGPLNDYLSSVQSGSFSGLFFCFFSPILPSTSVSFLFHDDVGNFFCKHTFSLSIFRTVTCNKLIHYNGLSVLLKVPVQSCVITSLFTFWELLSVFLLQFKIIFVLPVSVLVCSSRRQAKVWCSH